MKILCIVQARMGSQRLPGKVMKKVLNHPMITYTLDRTSKSKYIDEVILATSNSESEETMVNYVENYGYSVFRGSENNVLERYVDAAKKFGGEILIRITGDCPLIDPLLIDYAIEYYLNNTYDYVALNVPQTMIRGFDVEVFSRGKLEKVYEIVKDSEENSPYKEHVTLYMYKHPEDFSICRIDGGEIYNKDYRLCVDTEEDFELITNIYEHFKDRFVVSEEVIKYLDENVDIAYINKEIKQKQV